MAQWLRHTLGKRAGAILRRFESCLLRIKVIVIGERFYRTYMPEIPINPPKDAHRERFEKAQKKHKLWKEPSPDIFPLESYKVGDKLTIQAIPLEFYKGDVLEKHGEAIKNAIKNSDGVIFEYFPDELKKISTNPLVYSFTNVDWFMPYYEHAAKAAADTGKEIYAIDPAYKINFALLRQIPVATFGLSFGSYVAAGQAPSIMKSKNIPESYTKVVVGGLFGLAIGGTLASGYEAGAMKREHKRKTPSQSFTEPNFRRVVVAQGIKQLSKDLDSDPTRSAKKLVLLYPPIHWKGIKGYLDNSDKLNRNFKIASVFKLGGLNQSWFSIRNYIHDDAGWQLKSTKTL